MPPVDPAVLAERLAARSGPPDLRAFAAALLRAEGLAAG